MSFEYIFYYETNKTFCNLIFFFTPQAVMLSVDLAAVWFMGQEEPSVLGREGHVGLLSVWDPAWTCFSYLLRRIQHCTNTETVGCHFSLALSPPQSLQSLCVLLQGHSLITLFLPGCDGQVVFSDVLTSQPLFPSCGEVAYLGVLWGNVQIFSFPLKPTSPALGVFSVWLRLGQSWE